MARLAKLARDTALPSISSDVGRLLALFAAAETCYPGITLPWRRTTKTDHIGSITRLFTRNDYEGRQSMLVCKRSRYSSYPLYHLDDCKPSCISTRDFSHFSTDSETPQPLQYRRSPTILGFVPRLLDHILRHASMISQPSECIRTPVPAYCSASHSVTSAKDDLSAGRI